MLSVTKIVKFDAAHWLPDHKGACKRLHGHTWKVEVEVMDGKRSPLTDTGMIVDFKDLKGILHVAIIDRYDHQCLNDRLENPTAENIVSDIQYHVIQQLHLLESSLELLRVRVWESEDSYAEWRRDG